MGKIRIDKAELRVGRGFVRGMDQFGKDTLEISSSFRIGDPPFSAPIVYAHPKFEDLERRFPGGVSDGFAVRRFTQNERCRLASKADRILALDYVKMSRGSSHDQVLNSTYIQSLRPAVYEELLGFSEKYPDEQLKYPIVALADIMLYRGSFCFAFLDSNSYGRTLGLLDRYMVWPEHYRFLSVDE